MVETVRSKLNTALFLTGGGSRLLAWPENGSEKLRGQFLVYNSPSHKLNIARKVAGTLISKAARKPYEVGLVGSLARGTADETSDIDLVVFLDDEVARGFSFQDPRDRWDVTPIKDVYEIMEIEEEIIKNIVKEGIPDGSKEGIILPPIRYRFLILPCTADKDCINMNE